MRLWDPASGAAASALATIEGLLADLAEQDMLGGTNAASVRSRLSATVDLAEALAGAHWVQESAPEDLATKQALWRDLDRLADPTCILASSSSAIVPSLFTETLAGRARCLVCHPINPPYLIPAIELVPAPWTAPETMARAETVMRGLGQSPIVMQREIDGFVMNRMQGALLEEAFRLVADGYCTTEDIDRGLKDGLALRWSFIGPFETMDLNAPGGVLGSTTANAPGGALRRMTANAPGGAPRPMTVNAPGGALRRTTANAPCCARRPRAPTMVPTDRGADRLEVPIAGRRFALPSIKSLLSR